MMNFCDRDNIKKKRDIFRNYRTQQMDKMGLAAGTVGLWHGMEPIRM